MTKDSSKRQYQHLKRTLCNQNTSSESSPKFSYSLCAYKQNFQTVNCHLCMEDDSIQLLEYDTGPQESTEYRKCMKNRITFLVSG